MSLKGITSFESARGKIFSNETYIKYKSRNQMSLGSRGRNEFNNYYLVRIGEMVYTERMKNIYRRFERRNGC